MEWLKVDPCPLWNWCVCDPRVWYCLTLSCNLLNNVKGITIMTVTSGLTTLEKVGSLPTFSICSSVPIKYSNSLDLHPATAYGFSFGIYRYPALMNVPLGTSSNLNNIHSHNRWFLEGNQHSTVAKCTFSFGLSDGCTNLTIQSRDIFIHFYLLSLIACYQNLYIFIFASLKCSSRGFHFPAHFVAMAAGNFQYPRFWPFFAWVFSWCQKSFKQGFPATKYVF